MARALRAGHAGSLKTAGEEMPVSAGEFRTALMSLITGCIADALNNLADGYRFPDRYFVVPIAHPA